MLIGEYEHQNFSKITKDTFLIYYKKSITVIKIN